MFQIFSKIILKLEKDLLVLKKIKNIAEGLQDYIY